MRAELIISRVDKVRSTGRNKWIGCCPAHDDNSPSLSIFEADDGRILLHCFAGCGGHEIVDSLGITLSDLYPDGALREWFRGVNAVQKTKQNEPDLVLSICDNKRKNGERLTASEMQQEREAFTKKRVVV